MERIIVVIFGIVGLIFLFRLMTAPIRWIWKLGINLLSAFLVLAVFNLVGAVWGMRLGLNLVNICLTAILGLPGIGLIFILKNI